MARRMPSFLVVFSEKCLKFRRVDRSERRTERCIIIGSAREGFPMADPTAQGTFDEAIDGFHPDVQAIARALKSVIAAIHADFVEVAWPRQKIASYGIGPKKMSEHYAYIAPQTNYVNLGFYHGVALKDPAGLLEGAGKRLRHIKIKSISDANTKDVVSLLNAALSEREDEFRHF
jgi:hypothetical protein